MKSHKTNIDKQAEELLKLLGTEQVPDINPFLFSRIEQTIAQKSVPQAVLASPLWQSLIFAFCLILGIYGGWFWGLTQSAVSTETADTYFVENSFNDLAMETFEYQILEYSEK